MQIGREFAVVVGILAAGACLGQTSASEVPSERFDVASVKLSPPGKSGLASMSPYTGARFTATNVPLKLLVELAFGVDATEVSDPRDLLGSERYDVTAKPEGEENLSYERLKPLLRALLAERFDLVAHRETKAVSGYALVIAKGGTKLKANDGVKSNVTWAGGLQGAQITVDALAAMMARPLGRPVVNQTGIEGKFDVKLEFDPAGSVSEATVTSRPSIFSAVQEQLGLKLESLKMDTVLLVIDACRRVPTEN